MAVLNYDISVHGVAAVEAAFAKIESAVARLNRKTASGGGGTSRGDRASGEYSVSKSAQSGEAAARAADRAAKAAERAEKQKTQALERESKNRLRIVEREYRESERISAQQARARKKAASEEARDLKRNALLAKQQSAEALSNGRDRFNRISGIAGGSLNTIRNVGMMGMATAGLGTGALFATAIHSQIGAIAAASKLANQFSENGATVGSIKQTKAELLREAGGVRGFTAEETLGAMSKYHEKTGEAGSARRMVKKLGALSLASGASIEDVSEFGSIIHNVLKTKGVGTAEAEPMVYDLLKNAAAVAKEKSIELRDFARVGGSVIAQSPLLTGNVADNAKLGMSITQMAIAGGATSPEEAATSYQNMIADMVKHQKQIKKMGVKDSIQGGKLDLAGTLGQILEKTGGDIDKAMKVFNIRGLRAFTGLGVAYKSAEEREKGSGRASVMGELARLSGATLTEGTISAGVASRMADPDMQLKEAQKAFNAAIGKELVPVVTKLIPKIAELAPLFGQLAQGLAGIVEWFTKNPLTGVASLMAGVVVKDIAGAAIGDAIKRALIKALAGDLTGRGVGGSAGAGGAETAAQRRLARINGQRQTAAGALGAVGAGVLVGLPLAASLYESGVQNINDIDAIGKKQTKEARELGQAGAQFDKPFEMFPGVPVHPNSTGELERKANQKKIGEMRTAKELQKASQDRFDLNTKRNELATTPWGVVEGVLNFVTQNATHGLSGKKLKPGAGMFDFTGKSKLDEKEEDIKARELLAAKGGYMNAAPDLEKNGYSTETNGQGRSEVALSEAGGKLISAADALNAAADKLSSAGPGFDGGPNYQRPVK